MPGHSLTTMGQETDHRSIICLSSCVPPPAYTVHCHKALDGLRPIGLLSLQNLVFRSLCLLMKGALHNAFQVMRELYKC